MDERPTALVTGSARRLGRELAAGLLAAGWAVAIHARDAGQARKAAAELGAVGGAGADLTDPAACRRVAAEVMDLTGGRLDLLVNNAASFVLAQPTETTVEQWAEAFDLNARAPLLLVQAFLPALEAADDGLVVNISDHAAHEHWVGHAAHSASKAALNSLTRSLAQELQGRVRVNAIAPGTVIPTPGSSEELLARLKAEGKLQSTAQVSDALLALIADPMRTGEIVVL